MNWRKKSFGTFHVFCSSYSSELNGLVFLSFFCFEKIWWEILRICLLSLYRQNASSSTGETFAYKSASRNVKCSEDYTANLTKLRCKCFSLYDQYCILWKCIDCLNSLIKAMVQIVKMYDSLWLMLSLNILIGGQGNEDSLTL